PSEAILVIALGGLIGGLLRGIWRLREHRAGWLRFRRLLVEWPLISASQLIVSLYLGHTAYYLVSGRLPLNILHPADVLPLTVLLGVALLVYIATFTLAEWWRGLSPRAIFAQNRLAIALALFGPLPFVISAALIYQASLGGFVLLVGSLLLTGIGAAVLGRSRLQYRQQVVELQSLSAVNRTMRTSLDLEALLDTIYVQTATILAARNVILALYDPVSNIVSFPFAAFDGERGNLKSRPMKNFPLDYVLRTRTSLLLGENPRAQAEQMGLTPPEERANSWLGMPLLSPDRVLGAIVIMRDGLQQPFTEQDKRLLSAIATQSSIAIENAQLYRALRARAGQLIQLNDLSTEMSKTLDPQVVLETVARSASIAGNSNGAAIFLWWDNARTTMALAASFGLSTEFTSSAPLPVSKDLRHHAGQPLIVANVQEDTSAASLREVMLRHGIASWIELPLQHGDDHLGILSIYYNVPHNLRGDEVELLRIFANQAALSISNARLYRQTDEALDRHISQLSALAAINKELSSTLNLDSVFTLLLDRAIQATHSSHGVLLLNDTQANMPVVVASRGDGSLNVVQIMDRGAVSDAYRTGLAKVSHDLINGQPISQLGVPIARESDVMGVIMLVSQEANAYPEADVDFVSQLATQATIAMDNARLFEWMKDSRNRLQVILDSMYEAVIMFELDGTISLANPRVEALLGIDPIFMVGQKLSDLLTQDDLQFAQRVGFDNESLQALFDVLRLSAWQGGGKLSYRLESEITRFIDRTIVSVMGQSKKVIGLLMVFADATEERELMQARDDLSRMIVHDLRSPLTAINASMKLLGEMVPPDLPLASSVKKTTEVSQRALRKLLYLVDSLLDIAKMESGNINLDTEYHDLRPIAETVRAELMPLAEELDIHVGIVMSVDLPSLVIDGDKIERVLLNLVDNALKFTPVGGLVQIRARSDQQSFVRVEVSDTGPGIPNEYKRSIFDRFQQIETAKANRRGTGLGLTFCRLTVEAHGGRIWIEDNPGGGSIFAFTLPVPVPAQNEPV
ncbi:MAG TPA: GAF domain-containing protein, partial [Aggregatilineales bacterium]|nr:GAF domain-containing protein [Aggregatilineales bacterium]